jgi:hypothetical protein
MVEEVDPMTDDQMKPPTKNPCGSCPYRQDAPSGLWHISHYMMLPLFDLESVGQPANVFGCHQNNGHLCSGWVATHDMEESISMRIAVQAGIITEETLDACLDYETSVPLFESGAEACLHGIRDYENPSKRTKKMADKMTKKGATFG